jgi:hypothetical protein
MWLNNVCCLFLSFPLITIPNVRYLVPLNQVSPAVFIIQIKIFTAARCINVWRHLLSSSIEVIPRPHHIALWEVNTFHELKATVHHNPTCSKYLHAPTAPTPRDHSRLGRIRSTVTINLLLLGIPIVTFWFRLLKVPDQNPEFCISGSIHFLPVNQRQEINKFQTGIFSMKSAYGSLSSVTKTFKTSM